MFNRRRGLYTSKLFGFARAACLMNLRKKNRCGGFKIEHDGGSLKEGHPSQPLPPVFGVIMYTCWCVSVHAPLGASQQERQCRLSYQLVSAGAAQLLPRLQPACQPDGNERGFINNVTVCASSHVFYVLYCQEFPSHFQGEISHVFQTKSSWGLICMYIWDV